MKNLATKAIRSTFFKLDAERKEFTFEVFGLDFMIDQNLKPWLIEINTNPAITVCCSLMERFFP
jgi:hypothetical protein